MYKSLNIKKKTYKRKDGNRNKLNPKQILFIHEYLIGLNGTRAYMNVYDCKDANLAGVCAYELLRKPKIMESMSKVLRERLNDLGLERDRVIQELMRIAFYDIRQFYKEDSSMKGIHELNIDEVSAISAIVQYERNRSAGKEVESEVTGIVTEYKFHSKQKALEILCKYSGLIKGY